MKLALCLVACVASTFSKNLGSINVKDYGEVYVVAPDWSAGNIQVISGNFKCTKSKVSSVLDAR